MNITNFKKVLPYLMKSGISPMLWGESGVGKSAIVKQISEELGYNFIYLTFGAVEDNGDIIGLQDYIKDSEGNSVATKHLRPEWFPTTQKNIIFLDECNRMPKSVLQGMITFISDKKLHTHYLPNNSHIILAANPPTDDYVVGDFSDRALINRCCHICIEPTVNEFLEYCASSKKSDKVIGFLQENNEMIEIKQAKWLPEVRPNRRTWCDYVAPYIDSLPPKETMVEVISGLVGTPVAVRFDSYLKNAVFKIKGKDILNNYDSVLKNRVLNHLNDLDILNISSEELIREIKITKKLTTEQCTNITNFLLDLPMELCYHVSRMVLSLGMDKLNKTVGTNAELLAKTINKIETLTEGK